MRNQKRLVRVKKSFFLSSSQLHSYLIVRRGGKTSKGEEHTERLRTATDVAFVTTRSVAMSFAGLRLYVIAEPMPHYNQRSYSL